MEASRGPLLTTDLPAEFALEVHQDLRQPGRARVIIEFNKENE